MGLSKKKSPPNMGLRNGIWHLRMRVPARYRLVETKTEFHRTLGTGDIEEAFARRGVVRKQILAELDARLAGREPYSSNHFEAISALASARSFSYRTAEELAEGSAEKTVDRALHLIASNDVPTSAAATALLGGIERPRLTISEVAKSMPKRFPEEIGGKAAKSKETWKCRWTRPASKVVDLLGYDPVFVDIARRDAVLLRNVLKDRVLDESLLGESAKKEFQLLNLLWAKFHDSIGVDEREVPPSPFFGLGKGFAKMDDEERRKLEVPLEIIRDKLVPVGALDFMNDQLRDITLAIVETGARQSEITDLPPHSIILDTPVPYIYIRKETGEWAREIKNKQSKRMIPLVGVALEAFRRNPDGFPKYRYKGTYSADANNALHEHGVLPAEITIGGLRHSFESRMETARFPNKVRAELMGHSVKKAIGREVYGNEMPVEEKQSLHRQIMITPPAE